MVAFAAMGKILKTIETGVSRHLLDLTFVMRQLTPISISFSHP
jgi:hypothetical protein